MSAKSPEYIYEIISNVPLRFAGSNPIAIVASTRAPKKIGKQETKKDENVDITMTLIGVEK